jgi:glutathione S-transferase
MLDIALAWFGERFRPQEKQSEPHMELWRGKIRNSVDALEREADALAASRFTIGHVAIGIALAYLDFRFADLDWRDGHPRLAALQAMFDARPAVLANPPIDDR